jgi:hypothetical protein
MENFRLFCPFPSCRTGAPTAEVGPVTMRFGTTTVPKSESLNEAFCASDILRRGVKADSAYRARRQGNKRDDEVPHREMGWRAGRRGRDSNRGGEVASRGARSGMGRRNSFLTDGYGGKLPKSYRNLIEIDFGNSPLISKSPPNSGRRLWCRPVP